MNTLTDLKRLLDSGETICHGEEMIWKWDPNHYIHSPVGEKYTWYELIGEVITDPSLWRQRDQIGAEKQPDYRDKDRQRMVREFAPRMVVVDAIETLKERLEIKAGRLADAILKKGGDVMEDPECKKAFTALAHLQEVEKYLISEEK